jgi:hypothetical protein
LESDAGNEDVNEVLMNVVDDMVDEEDKVVC